MHESDLITTDITDADTYEGLLREAIEYAILSIPFTFDRMGIRDLKKKIINIAKGKFAENLFASFLNSKGISIDQKTTSTPFFQTDKRDFILDNLEWDIKNNYLTHANAYLNGSQYLDLLALIPNRASWDQWSKRNHKYFNETSGTGYVFTFMRKSGVDEHRDFFDINFSFAQELFIRDLYETYEGKHQITSPYEKSWFWEVFHSKGNPFGIVLRSHPQMIISGIATARDYDRFENFKPSQVQSPYLRTIISNMGLHISELRSFKSMVNL